MMMFLMTIRTGTPGAETVLARESSSSGQQALLISLRDENHRLRALSAELLMKNEQLRATLADRQGDSDTASRRLED